MAISPPGFVVEAPRPFQPYSKYGLLATIGSVELDDPHAWAGGVEWEQDLCTSAESYISNCPPAPSHTRSEEKDWEFCHADPFVIKSSYSCATAGRSVSEAFKIAKRRLIAWESHELEKIFWTGQAANGPVNPSLAFGNDTCDIVPIDLSTDGALTVVAGLGVLEKALADIVPGGGIIHSPFGLAGYLSHATLLRKEDGLYYSPTGFPIILGAGYPGSGPGNSVSEPGTTWIFGTGPMGIWRSEQIMNPTDVSEGISRYVNDITVFSERFYTIGFSCALYAVNVCL